MSAKQECGECKFWLKRSDSAGDLGGGYCRRFPPFFPSELRIYENLLRKVNADHSFEVSLSGGFLNDAWPNTHQQSWCGEFQRAKVSP